MTGIVAYMSEAPSVGHELCVIFQGVNGIASLLVEK